MSITLTQINDIIRQRYNAVGDSYFSDQYLYDLIWEAEATLAREGWVIEETYTTTSTSGTRELSYPTNTLGVREVRYKNNKLQKVPLQDDPKIDLSDPTGTPSHYAIWDNQIILFPTPDTSSDAIQVRVYLYPQKLTPTSALNVPDEYQIDLCNFVNAHMALKDSNTQLYSSYMSLWQQTVDRVRQQRQFREFADKNGAVRDVYFGGSVAAVNAGYIGGRYGF